MPNVTNDKVSVIVPIYNVGKYLDQALDSIQKQTHENLEILLLNDGSTDNSLEICQAHAAQDPRIVIFDRKNCGYGAECNFGLDHATGEWIAIVEPDDWIESGMYAGMLAYVSKFDETIDIIKTPYTRISLADTPEEKHYECHYKNRIKPGKQPFTLADEPRLIRHHPSIWSAIYRKDFLTENGIRFHEIPGAGWADNPFLMDTLLRAQNIVYFDVPYYCYREDTPEKERGFATRCPQLPFERWHDMTDIMEALNVTDYGILKMHVDKGFQYRDYIFMYNDASDPKLQELELAMYKRMDPVVVLPDTTIHPAKRERFAELLGIPHQKISKLPYYATMAKEALYHMSINGFEHTSVMVKRALSRMKH